MYVLVTHLEGDNNDNEVIVAEVNLDDNLSDIEALEEAYRLTQNYKGSWSIKDGNPDNDDRLKVMAPLHNIDGQTFGLRSSMIGDTFYTIRGDVKETFHVDTIGFTAGKFC